MGGGGSCCNGEGKGEGEGAGGYATAVAVVGGVDVVHGVAGQVPPVESLRNRNVI